LHQLDLTYEVPLRMLSRASHLERVGRWLARREQELQVRIARELVSTIEVPPGLLKLPGCAVVTAAKLLAEIGPVDRFKTDAQLARHRGVAPLEASSGKSQRHRLDRGGNRQLNSALYRSRSPKPATTHPHATTSNANAPKAKANAKHSAA
jgi:transposase